MHSLATQQSALLQALFIKPGHSAPQTAIYLIATQANNTSARGLKAYQSNAGALAVRSLQSVYPVVEQLIGPEAFAMLARDLWCSLPPTRGDLAQWGGGLADFVTAIPQLGTEPYLPDVARIEWALHLAATAVDEAADLASLALLTTHEPDALTLQLAPGTVLIGSPHPAASIVTAHLYASPPFEEVAHKLREQAPESALVWRHGLRPRVANCPPAEAMFVQGLLAGASLLAALESAPFDFNHWLPQAVQNGLLLGARLLPD